MRAKRAGYTIHKVPLAGHRPRVRLAARPAPGWMSFYAPFASWSFSAYNYGSNKPGNPPNV